VLIVRETNDGTFRYSLNRDTDFEQMEKPGALSVSSRQQAGIPKEVATPALEGDPGTLNISIVAESGKAARRLLPSGKENHPFR
jgi:hypothetical protein